MSFFPVLLPEFSTQRLTLARFVTNRETFANLPGGDSRLRAQQARIETRLKELQEMSDIKRELDSTHLKDDAEPVDGNGDDPMDGVKVKREDTEEEGGGQTMQDVVGDPAPELDEANSPQTKRRIAARLSVSNSSSYFVLASARTYTLPIRSYQILIR